MNQLFNSETLLHYDEKILAESKKRLAKLPTATICARKIKGHYRYSIRSKDSDGKYYETYLPNSRTTFIKECCEAQYLRKIIPILECEIKTLQKFGKHYQPEKKNEVYEKLPAGIKQNVTPVCRSNKEICQQWEYEKFDGNTYPNRAEGQYVTKKGESVRSRIELIVADILFDLGIPYRYENKLNLQTGAIYPDFTILHPKTLEIYYIEIFGMMDNPEYEQTAFSKISKYVSSGKYANLIMFFDHKYAPISPASIKQVLAEKFLS
ncbi:MAG: hypothetical protein Q4F55_00920 [Bacillota bacterium]|nr:hypothetical protein [Bacillota bacterium]